MASPDREQTLISVFLRVVLVALAIHYGYLFNQFVEPPGDR